MIINPDIRREKPRSKGSVFCLIRTNNYRNCHNESNLFYKGTNSQVQTDGFQEKERYQINTSAGIRSTAVYSNLAAGGDVCRQCFRNAEFYRYTFGVFRYGYRRRNHCNGPVLQSYALCNGSDCGTNRRHHRRRGNGLVL